MAGTDLDGDRFLRDYVTRRLASSDRRISILELEGIATGLVVSGSLTRERATAVLDDLRKDLRRRQILTRRQYSSESENQGSSTGAGVFLDASSPPVLNEVISLAEYPYNDDPSDAFSIRFVSLDMWSAFMVFRYSLPIEIGLNLRVSWRVSDNLGERYRVRSESSWSTESLFVRSSLLEPAPSQQATTLSMHGTLQDGTDCASLTVRLFTDASQK